MVFASRIKYLLLGQMNGFEYLFSPSRCPKCKKTIKPYYILPIVGYFLTLGRCKSCQCKIAFDYVLVEAVFTLSAFLVVIDYGVCSYSIILAIALYFFCLLCAIMALCVIDSLIFKRQLFISYISFYLFFNLGFFYAIICVSIFYLLSIKRDAFNATTDQIYSRERQLC
ncbi:prepilin peptidase [Cysteiniphilum halobium]|uniref:prepilin peptidase n=1 Tax=Cysteiniphilum halobium TaxID=2219059 RepID=UPI003F87A843